MVVFVLFFLLPHQLIFSTPQGKNTNLLLTLNQSVIQANEIVDLQIQLTENDGFPLANHFVSVSFDGLVGRFLTEASRIKTDENGLAKLTWQAGPYSGQATFSATLYPLTNKQNSAVTTLNVEDPPPPSPPPEAPKEEGKIMVGMSKECIEGTVVELFDKTNKLIMTLSVNDEGLFDTGCILVCGEIYVVKPVRKGCLFTPPQMPLMAKCCPGATTFSFSCECTQDTTGKIKVTIPPTCVKDTVIKIYDEKGVLVYTIKNPVSEGVYENPCNLVCGATYKVVPYNPYCTFTPDHQTVTAKCCPSAGEVTFDECSCSGDLKDGKIIVTLPPDCSKDTVVKVTISGGASPIYVKQGVDGKFDTGCVLKCGDTYRVEPYNTKCTYTPVYQNVKAVCCDEKTITPVTFKCSCSTPKTGKIKVKVPLNCVVGTKIYLQEVGGTYATYLTTANKDGVFESTCSLLCDKEYKVTPYNPTCTFTPAYKTVTAKCCPDYGSIEFDSCTCPPEKTGKISVKLPKDCLEGAKIYVTDSKGTPVMALTSHSSEGVFESPCSLTCDETYTITPYRANCNFTPATAKVTAKCCPGTGVVSFTACACEKQKGSILIKMPADCTPQTMIRITSLDAMGTPVYVSPNSKGLFDSGCVLLAGETYKVEPVGKGCTYTPAYQLAKATACTSTPPTPITFACSCGPAKNGKIAVQLPTTLSKDAKIYITDLKGVLVTQLTSPNDAGLFESSCELVCNTTYKVTVSHPTCAFSPSYQTVVAKCCPDYGLLSFTKYTCPPVKNGKIAIKIPKAAISGTKVYLQEVGGTFATYLTVANEEGVFETTCTLICDKTYKVTPYHPTCKFTPSYQTVVAKCCPDMGTVSFDQYTCPPAKTGKIKVQIPKNCLTGAKIYLQEVGGTFATYLTTATKEGIFESTCTLTCDKIYKVTPYHPTCTFTPTSMTVTAKCCPDYGFVVFEKCTCPPPKTGKIKVQIPVSSVLGTKIYLIDSQGKGTVLTTGNKGTGIFESTCTLICDETYTVQPINAYYTFSPATTKVVAKCCPDYGYAAFNSTKKTVLSNFFWGKRFDLMMI